MTSFMDDMLLFDQEPWSVESLGVALSFEHIRAEL